ncbi:hypothetical protein DPEC_G00078610 [Dallia pectoralis]|uniref:Uncharacterized protein n=1 Tax=Dallia pectoralis TaxID=75939 RepID=A0ACC2H4D6_DALPE|nr:hypothetical protein DPEC_G00078610 [Dallia pectoralis]
MTTAAPGNECKVTDSPRMDRVQLVRGRREEREKNQDREEFLRNKEQRARQQLERRADEQWRRMEERNKREEERRATVEERRRQQKVGEQERLEALVRRRERGGERERRMEEDGRDSMENRPKRWTWGGPPGGGEGNLKTPPFHAIGSALPHHPASAASPNQSRNACEFLTPPSSDQPITKRLSNSSTSLHSPDRASPSPQRPAMKGSPSRKTSNGPLDDRTPKTATTERGPVSALTDASMRRLESPTTPTRSSSPRGQSKGIGTPKRVRSTKSRVQSPCSPGQYPPSPLRQRPPITEGNLDARGHGTLERKTSKPDPQEKKIPKSSSRDLAAESPGTPTGRNVAGTTDAEEASRLLAERRRLARVQKEQEEKLRQEEERLRAEEEQRRKQEAQEEQAREAQRLVEERERLEEERKTREEEERKTKERRWKDMHDQLDREREEACLRAHREAERKRQERELLQIQEEQERLQRKKRIEEIMKRTRKSESDTPSQGVCEMNGSPAGGGRDETGHVGSPLITLGLLENKICGVDELSDGVQSMDVSPVSRDEMGSVQEFSPVCEGLNSMSNGPTLEHILSLTSHSDTPPYQAGTPPQALLSFSTASALENWMFRIEALYRTTGGESNQLPAPPPWSKLVFWCSYPLLEALGSRVLVGKCAAVNKMSRPRSRSPHYSHRGSPQRQDGPRFPWEDPGFDPKQVLADLGRHQWEGNRGPGVTHEDHWTRFMDEIHPDGHRRPMSPDNLHPEGHKINLPQDLHRLDHHIPTEDFLHGRTPPGSFELGYAERRRLSPHDGRGRLRDEIKRSEEQERLLHSPQRLPRERLPSLTLQHPPHSPDHHQREPSGGWRREMRGQSRGRSRDFSPKGREPGRGWEQKGGVGGSPSPYRDRSRNDMHGERSTFSERTRKESNEAVHPGYGREAEFRERRPSLERPRVGYNAGGPRGYKAPQGNHDGLGPETLIVEHDHGILNCGRPEPHGDSGGRNRSPNHSRFGQRHHPRDGSFEERVRNSGSRDRPVHEDRRGPVHEDRRGPVHEDRRGPVHEDRRGPVHEDRRGPVHEDRRGPVHEDRRGPVHEDRRGPVHEDRRGPVHEDRRGPVHEDRRGPVREDRRVPVYNERRGQLHNKRRKLTHEPRRNPDNDRVAIPVGLPDRSSPTQPRARNTAFCGLRGAPFRGGGKRQMDTSRNRFLGLEPGPWDAKSQHSTPERQQYAPMGDDWDMEPREEQHGWVEGSDLKPNWAQGAGPRPGLRPMQSRVGPGGPQRRDLNPDWQRLQKDMAVSPLGAGEEETLTIKVDMNRAMGQNSQLCYSPDRQLSLDLVNVGRQRLDFLPMLEHSGTYRESAMHSGSFAQEIITLVHQVKEHFFRGDGITLNERFSGTQDGGLLEEEKQEDEWPTLNRRFNMSMSEPDVEPLFSKAGRMQMQQPTVSDPGDLRHDLERRRQERLEGVKVTIPGCRARQQPMAAGSNHQEGYGSVEEEIQDEEDSAWSGQAPRGGRWSGHMENVRSPGQNMGGQQKNNRPPNHPGNRLGPMRHQMQNIDGTNWTLLGERPTTGNGFALVR